MAADQAPDARVAEIDAALREWQQGDCSLGEHWFVHRMEKTFTVTEAGRAAAAADVDLAEQVVAGLVVVTQTCDVVRSCVERPYVEVCPLVEVDDDRLAEIERARRPGYAFLPLLAGKKLVADLDRVMSVEKPLVAKWTRTRGLSTDAEVRAFALALALARKRVRFAFPDDFTRLASKLQSRLGAKHDKATDEGRGLRALREIRVRASPSWDAAKVDIFLWFVRDSTDADFEGKSWADLLKEWLKLIPPSEPFSTIGGQVVTLQDMTAEDYVDSDPLDLDHLSTSTRE